MIFPQPLIPVTLCKRHKRFLADVVLPDQRKMTVHCPDSGSMRGCFARGRIGAISHAANPKRKYPFSLEMIWVDTSWVGINTSRTNNLVAEALEQGGITELDGFDSYRREVRVSASSRLDFLLTKGGQKTFLEVKNCTLAENRLALFPDAITRRGTRHLEELIRLQAQGNRAAVLFCIQRQDTIAFAPAAAIDPTYATTLNKAAAHGVLVLAYQARVSPLEIAIERSIPIQLK